jgi:hypothetical protein
MFYRVAAEAGRLLGFLLLVAGCVTALPLATIRITDMERGGFYNVLFVAIDGTAEPSWAPFVRVTPGLHEVTFMYYSGPLRFEGRPITLWLDARPGRVYQIDGRAYVDQWRWLGWIVDAETGEIVSRRHMSSPRDD